MKKPKKLKCYVLTVSRKFPATHPNKGAPTLFVDKINTGNKRHTVRGNYSIWHARSLVVNDGLGYVSLRYWSGKPYASEQIEFGRLYSIHVQKVHIYPLKTNLTICKPWYDIFVDDSVKPVRWPFLFAAHDGLSYDDFKGWFKKPLEDAALIQFTNFKY